MIGCFAGPLLLLELILVVLLLSILINFEIFKKKKKKEEPKTFIQAGLRTILAQTMVPLPTGWCTDVLFWAERGDVLHRLFFSKFWCYFLSELQGGGGEACFYFCSVT